MATLGLCPHCMYRVDIEEEGWHTCARCHGDFCAVASYRYFGDEKPAKLTRKDLSCFYNQEDAGSLIQLPAREEQPLRVAFVLGPSMFVRTPDTFMDMLVIWRYMLKNYLRRKGRAILLRCGYRQQ